MNKTDYFENIELLKPYADPDLYAQMFKTKHMSASAALKAFWDIDWKLFMELNVEFPDEITPNVIRKAAKELASVNINISDIIRDNFKEELEEYEEFLVRRETAEFKAAYAAYLADPDAFMD